MFIEHTLGAVTFDECVFELNSWEAILWWILPCFVLFCFSTEVACGSEKLRFPACK